MGAWIETCWKNGYRICKCVAPLWERGLKPWCIGSKYVSGMSLPYGSVDWNIGSACAVGGSVGRSLMGAWIETVKHLKKMGYSSESLPYGSVDWNKSIERDTGMHVGRSLMGAWIETCYNGWNRGINKVAPLWERGLKLLGISIEDFIR